MKFRKLLALLTFFALLASGCRGSEPAQQVSFEDADFSAITEVIIYNVRNGALSSVSEPEKVATVCDFIRGISGIGGISAKGYDAGSYTVYLYSKSGEEYKLMFGDGDVLCYGDYGDGYPVRYMLEGATSQDVTAFFSEYEKQRL